MSHFIGAWDPKTKHCSYIQGTLCLTQVNMHKNIVIISDKMVYNLRSKTLIFNFQKSICGTNFYTYTHTITHTKILHNKLGCMHTYIHFSILWVNFKAGCNHRHTWPQQKKMSHLLICQTRASKSDASLGNSNLIPRCCHTVLAIKRDSLGMKKQSLFNYPFFPVWKKLLILVLPSGISASPFPDLLYLSVYTFFPRS